MVYPQSVQIAQKFNTLLGSATITHPFHPLCGQSYEVLKVKEVNETRLYSLRTDSGVMSVPESWTDRKVQTKSLNTPKLPFDAYTLRELAQLLQAFEKFPKVEKTVDKVKEER